MKATLEQSLQSQLQDRRARLAETMTDVGSADDLVRLLTGRPRGRDVQPLLNRGGEKSDF